MEGDELLSVGSWAIGADGLLVEGEVTVEEAPFSDYD